MRGLLKPQIRQQIAYILWGILALAQGVPGSLAAGIGAGVFTGVAVATIAGHSRPAFAFGMELFAFAGSQGAELAFLSEVPEPIALVLVALARAFPHNVYALGA